VNINETREIYSLWGFKVNRKKNVNRKFVGRGGTPQGIKSCLQAVKN
jgi:hypothetical protein